MEPVVELVPINKDSSTRPTSLPRVSRRVWQLILLSVAAGSAVFARFTMGPLQEALQSNLGLSDNQIALLQGPAIALPMALSVIPLGLAIDRYSRVRLLLLFAGVDVVAGVLTALGSSFFTLVWGRCLIGLASGATTVAAYSALADLYPPELRGRTSMVLAFSEVGGASAAFALGGELLKIFGSANGWRLAMLTSTLPLVLALGLLFGLAEPVRTGAKVVRYTPKQALAEMWRYRVVVCLLLIGRIMVGTADGASFIWAAPVLSRVHGLAPDRIGAIMATALLISGVLGPLSGGVLADLCQRRGGPRYTLLALAGLTALSIPASLFGIVPGIAVASTLLTTFITAGAAIVVVVMTLTTIVMPSEVRGLCMSVLVCAGVLFGVGLSPVTVSLLSTALGGPAMVGKALSLVCVSASLLCAVAFSVGRRWVFRS